MRTASARAIAWSAACSRSPSRSAVFHEAVTSAKNPGLRRYCAATQQCYNRPMRPVLSFTSLICAAALATASSALPAFARDNTVLAKANGGFTRNVGMINGRERSFLIYAPPDLKPGSPPVLVFHGGGGDGPMARIGSGGEFDALA